MTFQAPKGSDHFHATVMARVNDLVDIGIWDIEKSRVMGWISQFRSSDEGYFAACLLDSLMYRSDAQFVACATALFRGGLRWACKPNLNGSNDLDLLDALRASVDMGIRLVPVIRDVDPPTKSGPLVLRYIKRALRLNEDWMVWPWKVEAELDTCKHVHTVIFVDDFLGSGSQFSEFLDIQKLPVISSNVHWIYAPVIAHEYGISSVRTDHPKIEVIASEYLNAGHGFFDDSRWRILSEGTVTASDAKDFYLNFMSHRKIDTRGAPHLGFGELALCFGFKHSTPDNSLPILWAQGSNWSGFLER
jgi:hypothetical protein